MDIKELKAALVAKGWTEDRFGHFKHDFRDSSGNIRTYRVKVQKLSVRLERQYEIPAAPYSPAHKDWSKIESCYLKDIKVRDDGGIVIGKRVLK